MLENSHAIKKTTTSYNENEVVVLFCLEGLSAKELILLITEVTFLIAENKTSEQLDLLGNFFSAIGQNLSTMAGVTPPQEPPR